MAKFVWLNANSKFLNKIDRLQLKRFFIIWEKTMETEYIRRIDLAKKIGVHPTSLDRWVNPKSKQYDPNFPAPIRIGGSVFYSRSKVEQYLNH